MARYETACLSADLQPGDDLLSTAIGGHEGEIRAVRVYEKHTVIDFADGRTVSMGNFECCSVLREERPRMATVHPLFRGISDAASRMGR